MQRLAGKDEKYDLSGWCILTSYVLFHILKRRGYNPEVCKNDGHAFILCDGYYIDVTATQFNGSKTRQEAGLNYPPVYCRKKIEDDWIHKIDDKTNDPTKIWSSRFCKGWNQPVNLNNPKIRELVEKF